MKFFRKNSVAAIALAFTAVLALTGCGGSSDGSIKTENVLTDDYNLNYLRLNDTNVICYNASTSRNSSVGWACDFENVEIPNGVEVAELSEDLPESGDWSLQRLVDVRNRTSDCISYYDEIIACDFKSESAKGSLGEESQNVPSASVDQEPTPSPSVTPE